MTNLCTKLKIINFMLFSHHINLPKEKIYFSFNLASKMVELDPIRTLWAISIKMKDKIGSLGTLSNANLS